MTTNLYQVLYVGPPRYEGTEQERQSLRETVQSFIQTQGGRRSGLVGVKVGFSLGLFLIYTDSLLAAQCMPGRFEGFDTVNRFTAARSLSRSVVKSTPHLVWNA